ncbi:MAG: DUF2914 domain-containing protein [bacterium]
MSYFIGHSEIRKKSPLPAIVTILILAAGLLLFYVLSGNQTEELPRVEEKIEVVKPVVQQQTLKTAGQVEVLQIMTTPRIENGQIDSPVSVFLPEETVYCFTRVLADPVPTKVVHQWIKPDGGSFAVIDLTIGSQPTDTWSYLTLPPQSEGEWTVKVLAGEKILETIKFQVQ